MPLCVWEKLSFTTEIFTERVPGSGMCERHRLCPRAVAWADGVGEEGDLNGWVKWIHTQTFGPCGPEVTDES